MEDPIFFAVSRQVTVINLVVGCCHFPPGLRLLSQPEITCPPPWPVPNYTAWWQRHTGVRRSVPKTTTQCCPARTQNPRPVNRKSVTLPLAPAHYLTANVLILLALVFVPFQVWTTRNSVVHPAGRWNHQAVSSVRCTAATHPLPRRGRSLSQCQTSKWCWQACSDTQWFRWLQFCSCILKL